MISPRASYPEERRKKGNDNLTTLIIMQLSKNPQLSAKALYRLLKDLPGPNPLVEVTAEIIKWHSGKGDIRETAVSGLKDRFYRAKRFTKFGRDTSRTRKKSPS